METNSVLEKETLKWLEKLEKRVKAAKVIDKKVSGEMENVKAYLKDSAHFFGKKDFVRAFEAVIYAYGIYEACFRMGLVEETG
ncbi:MAG: DUF357 domain-containing protein [Candidatus Aenigmarchaeota archaeon]|nr:DUF357 domain-containing protein [Candidatus Aenigmarchaeota archaeon]